MGLAGQEGFPRGLVVNRYGTLQPRVGFSEDLFGNGKTVLRGGFGTFFERIQGNDIYNAATNAPFAYNLGIGNTYLSNPGTNWQTGQSAAALGLPIFATGVTSLAYSGYSPPATAQFSLGVQHELKPSMIWVVQYVGNLAWHQNIERNINNMPNRKPSATDGSPFLRRLAARRRFRCSACPATAAINTAPVRGRFDCLRGLGFASFPGGSNQFRTFQGYGGITQQENTTNGGYNGFQTGLRVQNKWGLSGELDYTWSHEIDLTSYDLAGVSNPWNLKYDKGSGALDRRNMISANYVYKLPFFTKGSTLTHSILGGWEIAGTLIDETGVPAIVNGAGGVLGSGQRVRSSRPGRRLHRPSEHQQRQDGLQQEV